MFEELGETTAYFELIGIVFIGGEEVMEMFQNHVAGGLIIWD